MCWLSRGPYEGIAPPKMRKEIFDFFKGVLLSCLKNEFFRQFYQFIYLV